MKVEEKENGRYSLVFKGKLGTYDGGLRDKKGRSYTKTSLAKIDCLTSQCLDVESLLNLASFPFTEDRDDIVPVIVYQYQGQQKSLSILFDRPLLATIAKNSDTMTSYDFDYAMLIRQIISCMADENTGFFDYFLKVQGNDFKMSSKERDRIKMIVSELRERMRDANPLMSDLIPTKMAYRDFRSLYATHLRYEEFLLQDEKKEISSLNGPKKLYKGR